MVLMLRSSNSNGIRNQKHIRTETMRLMSGFWSWPFSNELLVNSNFRNPNKSTLNRQFVLVFRLVYRCLSSNGSAYTEESSISTSDTKVERLGKWLKALNHDDCSLKLERCAQGSPGSGYGAFAGPGGFAKGSVIVKVPREALMTEEVIKLVIYLLTQLLWNLLSLRFY